MQRGMYFSMLSQSAVFESYRSFYFNDHKGDK